ncbi:dienelactone hydrolase family protein [Wenzhouxiangella sp. XN24]|uniref:dienelactone hydrolase family protein n=1 Tax=Wenzhouxiangella sp. XN24 TaxID=2713569 RepID=UPI0013EDB258|nr:dienelactone hydrolase [Wenzhouxiangella sp. XN24]
MSHEIVLFHSVLGLRPAVTRWAELLRAAGHTVHTPDLYDGQVFDGYPAGLAFLDSIGGIETLMARTRAAVIDLPKDVVYAGFSNGGGSAQYLALTRPGARGIILYHAALPLEAFGTACWPTELPVQIHYAEEDPFRDPANEEALLNAARQADSRGELWIYSGDGHLFSDPQLPDWDAAADALMKERTLAFLDAL